MTAHLHWLLLANGLAPLLCLCSIIVWVCEHPNVQGLEVEGADRAIAATLVTLTILNFVAAGMVWP